MFILVWRLTVLDRNIPNTVVQTEENLRPFWTETETGTPIESCVGPRSIERPTLSWNVLLKASRVNRVALSAFRISEHCFSREVLSLSRTLSSSIEDILREVVGVGGNGLYTSTPVALFLWGSCIFVPFWGERPPSLAGSVIQYHINNGSTARQMCLHCNKTDDLDDLAYWCCIATSLNNINCAYPRPKRN